MYCIVLSIHTISLSQIYLNICPFMNGQKVYFFLNKYNNFSIFYCVYHLSHSKLRETNIFYVSPTSLKTQVLLHLIKKYKLSHYKVIILPDLSKILYKISLSAYILMKLSTNMILHLRIYDLKGHCRSPIPCYSNKIIFGYTIIIDIISKIFCV